MLINEIIKYFNDLMSNNEPLMKFIFIKSLLFFNRYLIVILLLHEFIVFMNNNIHASIIKNFIYLL